MSARSVRLLPYALLWTLVIAASPASAQPYDHLQCYRVRDELKAKVIADLEGSQFGLASGCKVRVKAMLFCAPVQKTVTELIGLPPPLDLQAQELENDRICYKV